MNINVLDPYGINERRIYERQRTLHKRVCVLILFHLVVYHAAVMTFPFQTDLMAKSCFVRPI